MASNDLENAAKKSLDEFVEVYVRNVYGKSMREASGGEIANATAAYPHFKKAASGGRIGGGNTDLSGGFDLGTMITKAIEGQSRMPKGGYDAEFTRIEDGFDLVFDKINNRFKGVAFPAF